ncbi:MAG: hypothetical protein ISS80_01720 [Candidatus Cloacimonetes bacterium]|nr:hypothetical protein [Candidatus Cloacimonadota bacterium]
MSRKFLVLFIVLLPVFLGAETFQVLTQNEDELIVKFTLPEFELQNIKNKNGSYHRIVCEGAIGSTRAGYPQLPYFTEIVGLPVDGNIDIQIIDKQQQSNKNINIYPVEKLVETDKDLYYEFYKNKKAYKSSKNYPAELLEKGKKAFLKDRNFTGFRVHPFQYKAASKELVITKEITFRIIIRGDKTINRNYLTSSNFIDKIGDSFFLNNEFSKKWRKEKEKANYYPPRESDLVNEIQFIVDKEGIYKITYEFLTETLADPDFPYEFEMAFDWDEIDPHYLELSDENGPVPIHFAGESDGSFDPGDYFEFFGEKHYGENSYYDDYTSENVYSLSLTNYPGSRMAVENGGLGNINANQFTIPESYQHTVHFEEQNTIDHLGAQYAYNSPTGPSPDYYREDIWFWDKIYAPSLELFPFELQYPHQTSIKPFTARICLFSSTFDEDNYNQINHSAQVNMNSSLIDQQEWYGQTEVIFENSDNPLPNDFLAHGNNNLYINLPGLPNAQYETVMLDYFEVMYWREYKTDTDYIRFTKPQNKPLGLFQFEVDNFSNEQISVYKIGTSYIENIQVTPFSSAGGAPFQAAFQDSLFSHTTEYIALTEDQKLLPKTIRPNIPSNLMDPFNAINYVIITVQEFVDNEAVLQLEQTWESQGNSVMIVSLQDIFDEFNHGIRSADATKEFLSYAYNNWSYPELSHVLLLGDGITDERDNSPNRSYNLIPFRNVWAEKRGAITSDNWLACIVGDDPVADISISRINIWEEEQLADVVEKTVYYIENPNFEDLWHSHVTLAAGGNPGEGSDFAKQSERIRDAWIPQDYNVSRVYCNTTGLPGAYAGNTTTLISNINDGTIYLQFMGHGGGHVWADYNLLNKADITTFNNENYPLVVSLSCYASAFNYPQSSCIGEELILIPGKGAIAHVGFTGFGYKYADEDFGKHLVEGIFDKQIGTIGEIIDFTKAKLYAAYNNTPQENALIHGCALLGDPMIHLILPQDRKQIILNKYNFTEGDTLVMTSDVGPYIEEGKFVIFDDDDAQLPLDEYYPIVFPAINDTLTSSDFIIPSSLNTIYSRGVKLFAYGDDREITGMTNYTVGQAAVVNLQITPPQPTENDSIYISADFFDEDGIDSILCHIHYDDYDIQMINIENSKYQLSQAIPPHNTGANISFHFRIFDAIGDSTITSPQIITVAGPDLMLQHFELTEYNFLPAAKLLVQNLGSTSSLSCSIKLYDNTISHMLITSKQIEPLEVLETRWEYLELPLLNLEIQFRAVVNQNEESFSELYYPNNTIISEFYTINMFEAGIMNVITQSLDGNLECEFPADLLASNTVFYINSSNFEEPLNQPDINTICLNDSTFSSIYEIGVLNQSLLADSLGHFPENKKITLTFHYSNIDSLTQIMALENNFFVYRWEEIYRKWVYSGGEMDHDNNTVIYETNRIGTYTILQNNDQTAPYIEANVEGQEFTQGQTTTQGQEFTHGGYISRNGTISFLLLDSNGIDVFNRNISLYLSDGVNINEIERSEYSITLGIGNLIQVPMKYQLDNLEKGTYYLTLDCYDVNGNPRSMGIEFDVSTQFDIINVANYPNPVKTITNSYENSARTRFTYVLTDDADKVTLKIYTVSGRLIQTFKDLPTSVGYHEYPRSVLGWDCRDKDGYFLANGVYFYRIVAKKGSKKIEKIQKMAILK